MYGIDALTNEAVGRLRGADDDSERGIESARHRSAASSGKRPGSGRRQSGRHRPAPAREHRLGWRAERALEAVGMPEWMRIVPTVKEVRCAYGLEQRFLLSRRGRQQRAAGEQRRSA